MIRRGALAVAMLLATAPAALAADGGPVLVELFTSQGCSSCPPADAYLDDLAQRPDVVALAYHVDYWDGLGWKDPFSLRAATGRQRDYAARLDGQVYTPQIVVDGRSGTVGSDRADVVRLIAARARQHGSAPRLSATVEGWHVAIPAGAGGTAATVELVSFDPAHVTPVRAGENGGRTLRDANAVRSLRVIGQWTGHALELDVRRQDGDGARVAIILRDGSGAVIGAATDAGAAG